MNTQKPNTSNPTPNTQHLYSNGKLLLTGEYVVLDGALALAVPTTFGQSLTIEPITNPELIWQSLDRDGNIWFEHIFTLEDIKNKTASKHTIANRLIEILHAAQHLNPAFLSSEFKVTSQLDFPQDWGLGSSSTLINNIADWANVDAYTLLEKTFGGSGYDIVCAQHDTPITYQLGGNDRIVTSVDFDPSFKEHLYFVHLNQKQNSREGIAHYKSIAKNNLDSIIADINSITKSILTCQTLEEFNTLIDQHETIISNIIQQPTVKERLFSDFNGSIKSLGAWGGDFVLVSADNNPKDYFKSKGFTTILEYRTMVL